MKTVFNLDFHFNLHIITNFSLHCNHVICISCNANEPTNVTSPDSFVCALIIINHYECRTTCFYTYKSIVNAPLIESIYICIKTRLPYIRQQ